MHTRLTLITFSIPDSFPVIDTEFDRFEVLGDELEAHMREAKNESFNHETFAAA